MAASLNHSMPRPLFPTRKIVHMSMLSFAFLLPFLTWPQAAGAALLALLFNLFILPRLEIDLNKRARAAGFTAAPVFGDARAVKRGATGFGSDALSNGLILYPISVLLLILFYRHSMHVVAAVWAIMALGDGMASVSGETLRGPGLPYNRQKTRSGFYAFLLAGTLGAWVLTRWVAPSLPSNKALMICAATALVGAFVESLPIALDDNLSVPLVCGAFMFCAWLTERSALDSNLPYLGRRIILAAVVNLVFALAALELKTIDRSGAVTGFILGLLIYLAWGWKSFLLLLAFFVLGSLATRLGYSRKSARGLAERRGGARSWREALGNGLAPAFFAVLVLTTHREAAFLLALVAALAEAAGDTVSSEIGQWLASRAYLITTFKPVPAGENGGISAVGTAAGLVASSLIVALGYALGLCRGGPTDAALALAAALAGNLFDSFLGATVERRGLVTNGIVNFASTSVAGALAFVLSHQAIG